MKQPKNILIVEDDTDFATIISTYVTLSGNTPLVAHTGKKAKEFLQNSNQTINGAFVDYELPDCKGIDLIQDLCQYVPQKIRSDKIVLLTCHAESTLTSKLSKDGKLPCRIKNKMLLYQDFVDLMQTM